MAELLKPFIGAKDAVYCLMTGGDTSSTDIPIYGTIYPFTGLIEIGFDTGSSASILFADDGASEAAETVGEMKITLNVKGLKQADRARILGHTDANGIMVENTSDVSPYIAIGGKRMMAGGAFEYFWLPKLILTKPKHDGKTKAASIEYQTPMFEGNVVKLTYNNVYRSRTVTDNATVSAGTLTSWFNDPVISTSADLGALNVVVAKSTTKATFTFTKVGGGLITLTQANLTTATLPTFKGANAVPIAGAYVITNNGTATVTVTFTPTVAYGAVAVGGSVVPNAVYDQNGVYAVATGAVWTSD